MLSPCMRKLIYQLPADSPDSIRAAAFPSPSEEKLNRIGLRFEDVSPIIHSFIDTICLGFVVREREIIFDSSIDVTTATLRRWILDGKVISTNVGNKNLLLRSQ